MIAAQLSRSVGRPLARAIGELVGGGFSPVSLFAANEPGYVYDLNDMTTLFKDTAGTQPVTAAGDPVALRLGKERGLALGPELVTNGDFSNGTTGWTGQGSVPPIAVVDGALVISEDGADGVSARAFQVVTTVVGRTYRLSLNVTAIAGRGQIAVNPTNQNIGGSIYNQVPLGTGTTRAITVVFAATSTTTYIILDSGVTAAGTVTFDNVSVKELAGVHATQSDLTKRPLYSLLPANGVRNLANGSADVGNTTYWPADGIQNGISITKAGSGFDANGLPYVDYAVSGTASATSFVTAYIVANGRLSAAVGQQFTASLSVQRIGGTDPAGTSGVRAEVVGETSGLATNESAVSAITASTTETVISATRTLSVAGSVNVRCSATIRTDAGATVSYTVRIKALQFELGSVRTAYQFNYAATNIAEPPFSQVGALLYDGVDDFMVTPAVDFSGTDEVFLCHGVRKTSDAARGILVELGPSGSGRFLIDAPGPTPSTQRYRFVSAGSIASVIETANGAAPDTAVITGIGDISGDSVTMRRNGVQVATSAADQGTGNFANAVVTFGANGGTSLFFKGYEFSSICRGRTPTAAQIAQVEAWVNVRTAGAY